MRHPFSREADHQLRHGLAHRRRKNAELRSIGEEPVPGWDGGVKRMARWLKRWAGTITVKDPEKYLHAHARRRAQQLELPL